MHVESTVSLIPLSARARRCRLQRLGKGLGSGSSTLAVYQSAFSYRNVYATGCIFFGSRGCRLTCMGLFWPERAPEGMQRTSWLPDTSYANNFTDCEDRTRAGC